MAFSHGTSARLFSQGYNLSGYLKSINAGGSVTPEDATVLTSGRDKAYLPGLRDGTLSLEGLFDSADDAIDELLEASLGGQPVLTYLPVGDVFGSAGQGLAAVQSAYDVLTPGNTLAKVTASFQSKVGWERGLIGHALAQRAATGANSALDNGASSSSGLSAYLQVTAVTGTGGTITVHDSADNVTFAEKAAFAASTAIGAQRVAVTGTVRRYIKVLYTINGASSLTFQVLVCRK